MIESYYEIQCCCQLHRTDGLDDSLRALLAKRLRSSLLVARAIEEQDANGCWNPWWDWSEIDAHEWSKAQVEWQGVRTRIILTSLHNHGAIADLG